jgi:FKBP-type peptidyl-prolyl cis-trans isomerase 2
MIGERAVFFSDKKMAESALTDQDSPQNSSMPWLLFLLGKEIFNARKQKKPVSFQIGTDKVMQGWNEGVIGMRPGGSRMLRIPPELGYGAKAVDDVVPPHAHLIFIIELLELK